MIGSNIVEKCEVTLSKVIQPLTSDVVRVLFCIAYFISLSSLVGHLFQNTCGFFPRILAIHDIRAFFLLCVVFIPKYMTIFLQTRIYMRTKKLKYMRYKQAFVVYGVRESRRIRRTELYRQQKTPLCTMELKSNFSLNQAWPQWAR